MSGSDKDGIAARNRRLVLASLLPGEPLSRVEIARETGLAPATVNRLTATLLKNGLVREVGSDSATGGRPSMLVKFNPDAQHVLAADITQNGIELARTNLGSDIIAKQWISIDGLDSDQIMRRFVEVISEATRAQAAMPGGKPYVCVGISVPGPVTNSGVVTVAPAVGWQDVPVGAALSDHLSIPFTIENDVNLLAYAEYHHGVETPGESLVAIGVYQGVGAGIVENGRLWRGQQGAAGQFGRMLMDVSGLRDRRPGFGQVERLLGEDALRDRAAEASIIFSDDNTADDVFAQAQAGDAAALSLLEQAMDEYPFQIANLSAVVAPDTVVFAGLFEKWSDLVIPMLHERLEGNVLHQPRLLASTLLDDGKLIGASSYALDQFGGVLALA